MQVEAVRWRGQRSCAAARHGGEEREADPVERAEQRHEGGVAVPVDGSAGERRDGHVSDGGEGAERARHGGGEEAIPGATG